MITPRPYQAAAVDSLFEFFREHKEGNPIIALPTGTGKSIIIADFVRKAMQWPGQTILIMTHVKELIQQNHKTLKTLWPEAPAGIYSAGLKMRDFMSPIIFCGIASIAKRANLFGRVDLIIIDECHLVSPNGLTMYRRFIGDLLKVNPKLRAIGLSATPYRAKGGILTNDESGLFTHIAYDLTSMDEFNRLIDEGWIANLVPKQTDTQIDVSGVKTANGDYVKRDLQAACDKIAITRAAVQEMIALGAERKHWLVFASGIEHAEHVATELRERGISAKAVHSKMKEDRAQYIEAFRKGTLQCLVNNDVFTTGSDFPHIDLIGFLRPTKSPALWVQALGRGTRPCEGKKDCLVLDFAGNTKRLGPINDPVIPGRKRKGIGGAPIRTCPECSTMHHISLRICPECSYEYPEPPPILTPEASTDDLIVRTVPPPKVEIYEVTKVLYSKHISKANGIPCLKVTYACGLHLFTEFILLEHPRMRGLASHWWLERCGEPIPDTVDEALELVPYVATPNRIEVLLSGRYPEVQRCIFDWLEVNLSEAPF